MSKGKEPWYRYIDWRVFGPVLVLGAALHYVVPEHWPLSDLLRGGLSDAMMIAGILGMTVDRIAKDRLLGDVSRDIWAHLMGRDLPLSVKEFIRGALDTRLVCTRYEIRYRLEERPDGRLNVFVNTTREIQNFAPFEQTLPAPSTSIFLDEEPEFLTLACETDAGDAYSWPAEPNAAKLEEKDGALVLTQKPLKWAPHGRPGSKVTVTRSWRLVMRTTDTDISAHFIPSTGTTIYLDGKPPWIDFKVDHHSESVAGIWRIDEVLWQHAFRRVRWFDRRIPGPAVSPSSGTLAPTPEQPI